MKNNKKGVCYKYKDGRFLQTYYMGDGDYELILTNEINPDCLFSKDWDLSEILANCDGLYDDSGEYIADTLEETDLIIHSIDVEYKLNIK